MYDAIIVGARCAGSPTALLLARKGHKVLLLDRAIFPSDMPFSNHYIHQTGSGWLKRWGLLDRLAATGSPPIRSNYWNYGAYNTKPPLEGSWYASWSGVKLDGWHFWLRPYRVVFGFPANENLSLIGIAYPARDLALARNDTEHQYLQNIAEHAPDLPDVMRGGRRQSRFVGGAISAHVRKPYGPGWALVGDAGYQKDPAQHLELQTHLGVL